jgi:hypothetical protein
MAIRIRRIYKNGRCVIVPGLGLNTEWISKCGTGNLKYLIEMPEIESRNPKVSKNTEFSGSWANGCEIRWE